MEDQVQLFQMGQHQEEVVEGAPIPDGLVVMEVRDPVFPEALEEELVGMVETVEMVETMEVLEDMLEGTFTWEEALETQGGLRLVRVASQVDKVQEA